jgi:ABC-type transport system involved in cytochrome bd biosynthesis fused ATPase/permease subunit
MSVNFQAVRYCISAGFFAILWDLHHLEEVMENGANGSEQLQQLKTRLYVFMETMKELLMSGQNQTYMEEVRNYKLKLFLRWHTHIHQRS